MAMQGIRSLLLLLALLGLWLVQPSPVQSQTYQDFLRKHVDSDSEGGDASYCNQMMRRRGMTTPQCKRKNTFIHEDIQDIKRVCHTTSIRCKNGKKNCHEGIMKVTDCNMTGGSVSPNCRYQANGTTRPVVIACRNSLPVHFDK